MNKIDLKKYVARIDLDLEQVEQIKDSDCISVNYKKCDSDNTGDTIDLGTYSVELDNSTLIKTVEIEL